METKGKRNKFNKKKVDNKANTKACKGNESTKQNVANVTRGKYPVSYDEIKSNDIRWYDKANYIFDEAVRVPFDVIAGAPRTFGSSPAGVDVRSRYNLNGTTTVIDGLSVPGIMTINYHPTIGYSSGVNSPVNRAFTTMYGGIASKTTGAMQFQQADLAFFNTSLASVAAIIGCAKRCLEVATLYSSLNYYYPVDLLTALLGTQEAAMDVINNRDVYRAQINDLIYQFNALKIPAFVSIFERQYSIAHNVYADEDSVSAQLYVFKPLGYYLYDDTSATLKYTLLPEEGPDFSIVDYIEAAQTAMARWRNSSAFPLISGALQRAYPDNEFISLDMLTVDSVNAPIFDRNITWQINNSRSIGIFTESLDITQDVVGDFLVCLPAVNLTYQHDQEAFWRTWVYLNSFDHNESPEFVMEATRLIPALYADNTDDPNRGIIKTGSTELIAYYNMFYRIRTSDGTTSLISTQFTTQMGAAMADIGKNVVTVLSVLSKWRNAPRVEVLGTENDQRVNLGDFGDLSHYTCLYPNQLEMLHEAALQSLYWIGSMNLKI